MGVGAIRQGWATKQNTLITSSNHLSKAVTDRQVTEPVGVTPSSQELDEPHENDLGA
jgi:hypothetical protein